MMMNPLKLLAISSFCVFTLHNQKNGVTHGFTPPAVAFRGARHHHQDVLPAVCLYNTQNDIPPPAIERIVVRHREYEVLKVLGSGCFGTVYKATAKFMKEPVAIKVIDIRQKSTYDILQSTQNEIKTMSMLQNHPNIVNLIESDIRKDFAFLVMEYCSGGNLWEKSQKSEFVPTADIIRKTVQSLAEALKAMRSRNILHRDIKPDNLFITKDGTIKLGDFGLATVLPDGQHDLLGTHWFTAPEIKDSKSRELGYTLDTDLFSVGATMWHSFINEKQLWKLLHPAMISLVERLIQGLYQDELSQRMSFEEFYALVYQMPFY